MFWFRRDAAFVKSEMYDYYESKGGTYFNRLPQKGVLEERIRDNLR